MYYKQSYNLHIKYVMYCNDLENRPFNTTIYVRDQFSLYVTHKCTFMYNLEPVTMFAWYFASVLIPCVTVAKVGNLSVYILDEYIKLFMADNLIINWCKDCFGGAELSSCHYSNICVLFAERLHLYSLIKMHWYSSEIFM